MSVFSWMLLLSICWFPFWIAYCLWMSKSEKDKRKILHPFLHRAKKKQDLLRLHSIQALTHHGKVMIRQTGFFAKWKTGFVVNYRQTNDEEWFDLAPAEVGVAPNNSIRLKDIRKICYLQS